MKKVVIIILLFAALCTVIPVVTEAQQRTCKTCDGAGWYRCVACSGTGKATYGRTGPCGVCNGRGVINPCPSCNGKGVLTNPSTSVTCSWCGGTGQDRYKPNHRCQNCHGTGVISN